MLRTICLLAGLAGALLPKGLVETAARFGLENSDGCEPRPWVVPVARAEGVLYLFLARRGDASYSVFETLLGVIGLLLLLSPGRFVHASARLAYTDAGNCEWKPWVYPVARLFGFVCVLVAASERRKSRASTPGPSPGE